MNRGTIFLKEFSVFKTFNWLSYYSIMVDYCIIDCTQFLGYWNMIILWRLKFDIFFSKLSQSLSIEIRFAKIQTNIIHISEIIVYSFEIVWLILICETCLFFISPENKQDVQCSHYSYCLCLLIQFFCWAIFLFWQVNEGIREQENSDRLEWLQRHVQIDGLDERLVFNSFTNMVGPRKLIHFGPLKKVFQELKENFYRLVWNPPNQINNQRK